ncbi:MAG: sulfatase-like hydrolase/transferase [Burkholderiaceae bacterium]|nr:sulfatase-like hydrolase/transferase [Burkholderiaceae bacterium]
MSLQAPQAPLSNKRGEPGGGWAMFMCSFAALGLFWTPLVLLRQIDAFVAFLTPLELLRDAALAYVLLTIPAALLTLLALGSRGLLRKCRVSSPTSHMLAWCIVLVPTVWVCTWQFFGSAWAWLKATSGANLSIGAHGRLIASIVLLAAMIWLIKAIGMKGLMLAIVSRLSSLRRPALLLLALALVCLIISPPRFLLDTAGPSAAALAAQRDARPDIYLITIDTLAEPDARVCGNGPTLMPRLREFAQQGSCFSRHYTSGNFTTPSTATMETGALPWNHWAVQIVSPVAKPVQAQALAAQMQKAGYETHSISANLLASPRHHGTEAGYDTQIISDSTSLGSKPREVLTLFPDTTLPFWFSAIVPFLDTIDIYWHGEKHPYAAEYSYRAMLALLDDRRSGKPKFIWVHTLPPHDPFLPPPSTKYSLLPKGVLDRWSDFMGMRPYPPEEQSWIDKHRLRYQESIMGADASLGELLKQIKARGRLDNSVVLISSDHGESFERGFLGHAGAFIHNAVLQVPLVIRLPGQTQGIQVDTPVSLADLAPTIVDLAAAPALPHADGRSLRSALEGQPLTPRPVFAMAMERQSRFQAIRAGHYAIIDGDHKLVLHLAEARSELFNLRQDPLELKDLSASDAPTAKRLRQQLEAAIASAEAGRKRWFANKP